ncbi:hypothetical protein AMTRI_Chr13g121970 [Amborella trichopoda]
MLAYLSIGQIGYAIIGIIVGDSNDGYTSMTTYMIFYIYMNLGTFAPIVLFDPRTRTDNIREYARLYTKDHFLALSSPLCLLSLYDGWRLETKVKASSLNYYTTCIYNSRIGKTNHH